MAENGTGDNDQMFLSVIKELDRRIKILETAPSPPKRPFEPDGEALEEWVSWLADHYAVEAVIDDWQNIPPLKHELAGLCRARAMDDGSAFYLVTFNDALQRFCNRANELRSRWTAQQNSRLDAAARADRAAADRNVSPHGGAAIANGVR